MEGQLLVDEDAAMNLGMQTELGERIAGALIAGALVAAVLAGCGGGSSSSANSSDTAGTEQSAEFLGPTGKNETAEFGEEADDEEREAASQVLEENLEARAAGDWQGQCDTLSATAVKKTEERAEHGKGCVVNLKWLAGNPPSSTKEIRTNTMTGSISALRVKGNKGFALYHGTEGKDYAMEMEMEDGEWNVGSLTTTELP